MFYNPNWEKLLRENQIFDFQDFWELDIEWIDDLNKRGDGWSGVAKLTLQSEDGIEKIVYVKKQENYMTKSIRHPFSGILTFEKEFNFINIFKEKKIPVLNVVFFATQKCAGKRRAILVTENLTDFQDLELTLQNWQGHFNGKRMLIKKIGEFIKNMHNQNVRHNCLYPKHIFIKKSETQFEFALIDLEKARLSKDKIKNMLRDLDTLNRHIKNISLTEKLLFLLHYLGKDKLDHEVRHIFILLQNVFNKKKK